MEMFEAVARMDEIVGLVRNTRHELSVAILQIPDLHLAHERKELGIKRQRIRLAANVHTLADEIAAEKIRLSKPPRNGLTEFLHERLQPAGTSG
jgi:hypothetical protein